ncbi:MAG: hypothetical protein ABI615_07435 [Chthoniobacterales bacterium]
MTTHLEIAMWMLTQDRWIEEEEICSRFHVNERALRGTGRKPGLLSTFAISRPQGGFKHVRHASKKEWSKFLYQRGRGIFNQLYNLRHLCGVRKAITIPAGAKPLRIEPGTGQLSFLP